MAKVNLLSALAVGTRGDGWHADGGNLYLRVSDGGKRRRWVFRYVRGSKTTEIGLGGADTVSLKAAREMRQRIADDLAKGVDVRAERQRAAEAKTFADVAKVVIARDREHWGASSLDTWERAVFKHAESLGGLSVASVSI